MKLPLRFDMTTTRSDFHRLLPAAVNHVPFNEVDGSFVYRDGERGWRINLEPLPQLHLGMLRLERHRIHFEFDGYSDREIDDFMTRFEVYFRRGGG